jgi:hypothetical protein
VTQVDGALVFEGDRRLSRIQIEPGAMVAGESVELRFHGEGVSGLRAEVGLLPARAAAVQEVRHGQPGQPDDARILWRGLELNDGENRVGFEIPGEWLSRDVVFVSELHDGGERIAVVRGPRSEMVRGGRSVGGRAILALGKVETRPVLVEVPKRTTTIELDGKLVDGEWPGSASPLRMASDGEPQAGIGVDAPTELWFAHDESHLYVAARIPDVDIFSRFEDHDDRLWTEEALELFVHGEANDRDYIEYQLSARNVSFDAHFERYRKGDEGFDSRWETAVHVDGTVNDDGDRDRAWSVEARIPWDEICERSDAPCPMTAGSELRLNVVRVERVRRKDVVALTLSPLHSTDFHAWRNAAILRLAQ